jgi:ferrochelatase
MSSRTAILLLAHGTPESLDEIPEYLSNITGGRPLPNAVVEEIRHRYALIGTSPLTTITMEQGRLLSEKLSLPVYIGMRNWKPYIADVVRMIRADGVTHVVAICLAPQNSRTSVGLYRRAVFAEMNESIHIDFIEGWADHPLLADAFAERLRAVWNPFCAEAGKQVPILFTAHSVPCRTIQVQLPAQDSAVSQTASAIHEPDPYAIESKKTAALVAQCIAGLSQDNWFFAFQSQGMSGGPWIGPTVEDMLTSLSQQGVKHIVVHPIGFLCDHVEILYDVDIGFRQFAEKLGMTLKRPESLNASALLIDALADLASQGLARLGVQ